MKSKKYPNIWTVKSLIDSAKCNSVQINGKWVPARPLGYMSFPHRLKCAWMVFTGKADVVIWPEGQSI